MPPSPCAAHCRTRDSEPPCVCLGIHCLWVPGKPSAVGAAPAIFCWDCTGRVFFFFKLKFSLQEFSRTGE